MITVDKIQKHYGDFNLDLSLQIPAGRITGLIGKNGAGKSTTIKAILGLIHVDQGSVKIMGKEIQDLDKQARQQIGVALSDSGFSQYLTIKDITRILDGMYTAFDKKMFVENCKRYGLPLDKKLQKFSTGMKAKLRVLVALSYGAKLLIMDEPTAGMDVEARQEILDMLRDYMMEDEERSILITSHIATDLEGICDDVYLIHKGKLLLHEDTDEILSCYGVLKMSEADYDKLDRAYVLNAKKEEFGYCCLTNQKQYYKENYPGMIIEHCGIDNIILMLTGGR